MTAITTSTPPSKTAFVERLLQSTAGMFDMLTLYLGDRLGFYKSLAQGMSLTSVELAARTNTQERYVREWLEQQTVAGILEVQNADASPFVRRYRLPDEYVEVLTDRDSLDYLAPLASMLVGVARPLPQLLEAYQQGGGVPYSAYGQEVRDGQAGMNRAIFLRQLGAEWMPALPDVHARLQAQPSRIADIGCGAGWSSIAFALTYSQVRVDGYDLDGPSVELARINVQQAGVSDRVQIHQRDASDPTLAGQYDLVSAFECLHDMGNPVAALQTMRQLAGDTGTVLIGDERVGDQFTPQGNDIEWMMYGWSVLHCLPVGMADGADCHCGGTGTVMRTDTLWRYAQAAGFVDIEILPIEHFFFRFYRLSA